MLKPGKEIDFSEYYELLAKDWANHLDKPFDYDHRGSVLCVQLIRILWNVYPEVIELIECDPVAFSNRVALHRLSMRHSA